MARQNFKTSGVEVTQIEVGNASDTSISRSAAGRIAVEGINVVTTSSTDTLTNKTLSSASVSGTLTVGGSAGISGYLLQSTGTGVQWVNPLSYTTTTVTSNSATQVYSFNPSLFSSAELIINVSQGQKRTTQKALVNHDSASVSLITNYAVLEHGTTRIPLTIGADSVFVNDAATWVTRTSNFTTTIRSVAFGNSLWVAGGYYGNIRTSTDAITWVTRTSNFDKTGITSVAFGNNLWVAGGYNEIRTSTDAITWVTRTSTFTSPQNIRHVAFVNNIWLAGGNYGQLRTSTDAITWVTRTSNFGNNFERSIDSAAFGNSTYVIGGSYGQIRTSTDAITWVTRTSNMFTFTEQSRITSIVFANSLFVAAADFSQIRTSTDGITWVTRNNSLGLQNPSVAFGNGLWVVAASGGTLASSTDTITWVSRTSNFGNTRIASVAFNNDLWVAGGNAGQLRTATPTFTNVSVTATITDAATTNATVKVVPTLLEV